MKKLAKILALVLSLVMVVSCFAACSSKEEKKEEPTTEVKTSKTNTDEPAKDTEKKGKSDKEEVEAFVEDFFKTFQSGDIEALADFFAESTDAYDELMASFDMGELDEMVEGMDELGLSEDEVADMLTDMFEALFGELDYEIGDIEVDGDNATAEFKMSIPDYSAVDESSIDTDTLMLEALEDAGYTMEELGEMTEDEIMELMPEIMGTVMGTMVDAMIDEAKKGDKLEEEGTFELEKIDGDWYIVAA